MTTTDDIINAINNAEARAELEKEILRLKKRLAGYEKIFARTAVIEFWGNQEIYQHSGSTGIWLIEGSDTEYNSAIEAFAALQGETVLVRKL